MLEGHGFRVPVTALALTDNFLFVGEGPVVRVYSRTTLELIDEHNTSDGQAVHGILLDPNDAGSLLVWGGSLVSILHISTTGHIIRDPTGQIALRCPDWILNAAFRPSSIDSNLTGRREVALVTAHNAVLTFSYQRGARPSVKSLVSQSRCILCSAHAVWTSSGTLLVAAGTIFGDIIVWSCHLTGEVARPSLHRILTGHDGSIFGVSISSLIQPPGCHLPIRLLSSCSDDRTIRIWDITHLPDTAIDPQVAADLDSARETGFGADPGDALPEVVCQKDAAAWTWAHASRIWSVKFVGSTRQGAKSRLVSFGEDATYISWDIVREQEAGRYSLVKRDLSSLHAGKNIWSAALDQGPTGTLTIATGGADGCVALESSQLSAPDQGQLCREWTTDDIVNCPNAGLGRSSKDKLRAYAFLSKECLLVAMHSGNLFTNRSNIDGNAPQWYWAGFHTDLISYSVMASIPSLGMAFVSGKSGAIFQYHQTSGFTLLASGDCKTAALSAQRVQGSSGQEDRIAILVHSLSRPFARLILFDAGSRAETTAEASSGLTEIYLDLPSGFIVTSFKHFAVSSDGKRKEYVALGSRDGAMSIYELCSQDERFVMAVQCVVKATESHGSDAVTDIAWMPEDAPHDSGYLFSTGRDATLVVHQLFRKNGMIGLRMVHKTVVPGATSTERILLDLTYRRIIIGAFRSKYFIVYDFLNEKEVLAIDCGGANRTWTFTPSAAESGGSLAWTKASQLCMSAAKYKPVEYLHSGGHGREIKAVAVSSASGVFGQVIATGAEDTDIKLHRYEQDAQCRGSFRCIRTLQQHNTGVRHLEWSIDGRRLFSSGGFEELSVWRLQPVPLLGIGVYCESVCVPESDLPDLRITCFVVTEVESQSLIPEEDKFVITTVRSDSTIKTYIYTSSATVARWSCISSASYLSSCLTQALHLLVAGQSMTVIAGTDGHLAFNLRSLSAASQTTIDSAPKFGSRQKIHQSTVHCLAYALLDEDRFVFVSGGDDNALTLCMYNINVLGGSMECSGTLTIPNAHAAGLADLAIIKSSRRNAFCVITAGVDQRIKLWEAVVDASRPGASGIDIRLLKDAFTPVADVSSLALLEDGEAAAVIVCGVGMEVWRIQRS